MVLGKKIAGCLVIVLFAVQIIFAQSGTALRFNGGGSAAFMWGSNCYELDNFTVEAWIKWTGIDCNQMYQ